MNTFSEIKESYRSGRIDKASFVQEMHGKHRVLSDYGHHLASCNIGEIKITPTEVIATFKNPPIAMVCPPADARIAPIEAFNFGDYEPTEIRLVKKIVGELGGVRVRILDIGANAGFYSLVLSHYFPGIAGVAFEPIPATYSYLVRNFELNGITGIEPRNLGLSDQKGELVFYTYPSQSGSSSMTRNVDAIDVQEVRCPVMKLDDFCGNDSTPVGFIKCDVEGAELFVFKGGKQVIDRDRPLIFTEMLRKWCAKYQYHPNDIVGYLGEMGYGCFVVRDGKLAACESITLETVETNFVFLHLEKHSAILNVFGG